MYQTLTPNIHFCGGGSNLLEGELMIIYLYCIEDYLYGDEQRFFDNWVNHTVNLMQSTHFVHQDRVFRQMKHVFQFDFLDRVIMNVIVLDQSSIMGMPFFKICMIFFAYQPQTDFQTGSAL